MKPRWQFDVIASESWLCFAEDATYEVQRPLFCLKASGHHVAHGQGACNPGENVPNPSFNSFSPRGCSGCNTSEQKSQYRRRIGQSTVTMTLAMTLLVAISFLPFSDKTLSHLEALGYPLAALSTIPCTNIFLPSRCLWGR